MTAFAECSQKYKTVAMERRNGILQMESYRACLRTRARLLGRRRSRAVQEPVPRLVSRREARLWRAADDPRSSNCL